jgi:hypothetical protein
MTTRYYSRVRAVQQLLPLLSRSKSAHVLNVLGGGEEGPLNEDDLDLKSPKNFSFIQASIHSATMLTLVLERFASQYPKISFVHAFPGLTATPLLTRGSKGIAGFLLRWIVSPLINTFIASGVDEVASRTLLYLTNPRYSVPGTFGDLPAQHRVTQTPLGLFLVNGKGEAASNEKILVDLRQRVSERVWDHTQEIFERVTTQKP